jgi:hypothetical protein
MLGSQQFCRQLPLIASHVSSSYTGEDNGSCFQRSTASQELTDAEAATRPTIEKKIPNAHIL